MEANPFGHLILSNGKWCIQSQQAHLVTVGWRSVLLKEGIWLQVFQLRKGVELQHIQA
jgi:hypothetical protein